MNWIAQDWRTIWGSALLLTGIAWMVWPVVGVGIEGRPVSFTLRGRRARLLGLALALVGLFVVVQRQLAIDGCLDSGGRFDYQLKVSQLVLDEATAGDQLIGARRLKALRGIPVLSLTDSATRLAKALVRQRGPAREGDVDAFHIGIAAAHQMAYLLTWNCEHLANATCVVP